MKFSFSILLLFYSLLSSAQNILSGKVTDSQSGEPLAGAIINTNNNLIHSITSSKGYFKLSANLPIDTIEVSFVGYEGRQIVVSNDTKFIEAGLMPLATNMSGVTVVGYENNRKLLEISGPVASLGSREIKRGDGVDIMSALNTIPGVKMEAYVTGDYRISIRGSLLNNPWGIRNVKLYWNDIPLSSPDGTASHGVDFDPSMIGSVEVLKGPSGSTYGSGNGGVILFRSDKASQGQNFLEAGYNAGSYGLSKFNTTYKMGDKNFNLAASIVSQSYNGYRENGWSNKDAINIFSQFLPDDNRTISLFVNHSTGSFGLSGGLNLLQVAENPRQALQYSRDNKTSVKKFNTTQIGISQTYKITNNLSNYTSIYSDQQTLYHPYGESIYYNGFLKESTEGYGVRSKFVYATTLGSIKSRFTAGAELMYQHQFGSTYDIIQDVPGTWPETGDLFQSLITISKSNIIFAQAEFDLPKGFLLTAGSSFNQLSYNITDLFKDSAHVNYSGEINFPKKISPRVGLVKLISKNLAAHGSISYGYAPPPLWELNNFDGTLNKNIKPEDGVNYELGLRGDMFKNLLSFDITAYQMFLTNAIVPVANQYGTSSYRNAGSTNQKGIEAMLSYLAINKYDKQVSMLKFWSAFTFNNYKFQNYAVETFDWNSNNIEKNNYSGNKVTGVIPISISAGVDAAAKCGIYFNAVYYYYDKSPMNDANTYYNNSYSLLNSKLGFKKTIKQFGIDVFAGVNNAFDTKYSSLINFNADATAYGALPAWYNPSPGINFYGGVKLKYKF